MESEFRRVLLSLEDFLIVIGIGWVLVVFVFYIGGLVLTLKYGYLKEAFFLKFVKFKVKVEFFVLLEFGFWCRFRFKW